MGGYISYFQPQHHSYLSSTYHLQLGHFDPWAVKIFSLQRFKQIRAAYHPEVGSSAINDNCHQLWHVINCINKAAKKCFVPGLKLSFDEGGIASQSRHCLVRQYNKDKPDEFCVELFCLANCDNRKYFIYHVDVYQGRNIANIDIPEDIQHFKSTQKAVVNALIKADITNDPDGIRENYCDSRYQSPEASVYIREKLGILQCGTCKVNCIRWDKDAMYLLKLWPRGSDVVLYDKVNKVLTVAWSDNKVVNVVSTLSVSGKTTIQRRIGKDLHSFPVEKCVKKYQQGMGGVDAVLLQKLISRSGIRKLISD